MDQFSVAVNSICVAAFAATLLLAAASDYRRLEIPNWMSIVVALLFIPAGLGAGLTLWPLALHVGAGLGLLVAGAALFALGLVGGGDVKLLAAVGMWFGPQNLDIFLFGVVMVGGVIALLILLSLRTQVILRLLGNPPWIDPLGGGKQPMPYGVAITIAGIALIDRIPAAPVWLKTWISG